MADSHDKESSGIVCTVSRQAGAVAGASVVISKKIAVCGIKTIASAKDCLKQPLKRLVSIRAEKNSTTCQTSATKLKDLQETGRKKAAKALILVLESDLATAQHELKKAHSNAEKTRSKLASQLDELKVEKEALISDLEQAQSKAGAAATREDEVKTRVVALEADLTAAQRQLEIPQTKGTEVAKPRPLSGISIVKPEKETVLSSDVAEKPSSRKTIAAEKPALAALTDEQLEAAAFANPADKIIFMRAFADISSDDATVRVDAARTMAGICHELSIKVLAAQMTFESSAQVRQECIKALAAMKMAEALPAVEHALTDEAGSVRLAAVWGLYHLAGAESAPALIRMFADNDEEVRRRAATCVGWLGKEYLAVELLPLLYDNSISVRRAAVEAMGNLRNRQVVSALIERLNDPVESIRRVVLSAVETITGKKMCKSFPKDEKEFERLVVQWRQWRKEQLLG